MSLGAITISPKDNLFYPSKFVTLFYCVHFASNFILGQVMRMKEKKKTSLCHLLKSQFLIPIPTMYHRNAALKSNPQQTQSTQSKTLTPNSECCAP